MQGEECRHKRAPPEGAGHQIENQKQRDRGGHVNGQTHHMMSCRVETKHFDVQRVRQITQRPPVIHIGTAVNQSGAKRPVHRLPTETIPDMRIQRHIHIIVVIDEFIMAHREIDRRRDQRQHQADRDFPAPELAACHCGGRITCHACQLHERIKFPCRDDDPSQQQPAVPPARYHLGQRLISW